jgi:hypothetical protein
LDLAKPEKPRPPGIVATTAPRKGSRLRHRVSTADIELDDDRVVSRLDHTGAVEVIEKLKVLGVRQACSIGSRYDADPHKHWWARTVSNRRPLVCKTRALPLSYAPVPGKDTAPTTRRPKRRLPVQAFSAVSASIHSRWSRASPGCFISANRIVPDRSMTNVPRLETPAASLNTP